LSFRVRLAAADDLPAIRAALAWAIDWRGTTPGETPEEIIERTGHAYLLADWGREGDAAMIAETISGAIGAAWYRHWTEAVHTYGYVDPTVPDLGIGVHPDYRGRGVGTALVEALLQFAASAGVRRMSLSVEADNRAQHLYQRAGFERLELEGGSWTMVRRLNDKCECRIVAQSEP
jgi:ribosomal protein S18 acetylase RimI-like enzyme